MKVLLTLIAICSAPHEVFSFLCGCGSRVGSISNYQRRCTLLPFRSLSLASRTDDDEDGEDTTPSSSRLAGNPELLNAKEVAAIDEMITKMRKMEPLELPNAVANSIRVVSSPKFFLRIVERIDMTTSSGEKKQLAALAENVTKVISAVMSSTEEKLDRSAKDVENVVKASAEPESGEYLVPLLPERISSMRKALLDLEPEALDEGFLTTVDAWMRKSVEDGMDGMATILQKVLQIYAGTQISRARGLLQQQMDTTSTSAAEPDKKRPSQVIDKLLVIDCDDWDNQLREEISNGIVASDLILDVQRTIEGVILGLENGSMAQRVQSEYLKELLSRIESLK